MPVRRIIVSVFAFWMVAMLLPTSASAQFRIRVENLTQPVAPGKEGFGVVVTDEAPGDASSGLGTMNVALDTLLGPDSNSGTIGVTKPVVQGDPGTILAELSVISFNMTTLGPITLRLTLEDTNYLGGPGQLQLSSMVFNGSFISGGATVTTTSWASPANYVPALGADSSIDPITFLPLPGGLDPIGAPLGSSTAPMTFSSAGGASFGGPASTRTVLFSALTPVLAADGSCLSSCYSLYTQILIDIGAGGGTLAFSQDNTVTFNSPLVVGQVPEPGSLMLFGAGLLGLVHIARRRDKQTHETHV